MTIKTVFLILLFISGCKNYENQNDDGSGETAELTLDNVQYEASLASTGSNVNTISGKATVDVQGDTVTVNVSLSGVPQNTTRLHYAYVLADCNALTTTLPNDTAGTRSFTLNETISLAALQNDIASSGAASGTGDTNLGNKHFIVKAFSTVPDQFNTGGSASVTIACGPLNVAGEASLQ